MLPAPGTLAFPAPGEVQVWWTRLDPGHLPEPTRTRLRADVDPGRLERLARFRQQADRDRGLVGHALLRRVLAGMTGGKPSELEFRVHCPACDSDEHGKPYLVLPAGTAGTGGAGGVDDRPVPQFNLSHSGPVVAVALARGPVGVDVEASRPVDWTSLRRSVFADSEWQATEGSPEPDRLRTQLWSRKEAAVKASGHGLALPLNQVVVMSAGLPAEAGSDPEWTIERPQGSPDGPGWSAELPEGAGMAWGRDLDLGPGVGAAVAALAPPGSPGDPVTALSATLLMV